MATKDLEKQLQDLEDNKIESVQTDNGPVENLADPNYEKLNVVLKKKLEARVIDENQYNQILTNYEKNKNSEDIQQYLDEYDSVA